MCENPHRLKTGEVTCLTHESTVIQKHANCESVEKQQKSVGLNEFL